MVARSSRWMMLGAVAVLVAVVASTAVAQPYEVDFQTDVQYGTGGGEPLTLHLAVPKGGEGSFPGIVYIHGGAWRMGDKNAYRDAVKRAAAAGYVAATVGYRFVPQYRFPAQVEDVKCAVRWMRAHADELRLDPDRIGAVGASAGAHLSMMLGTMDPEDGLEGEGGWADQPSKVQAVVAYFGPTNFAREFPQISRGLLADFIGGPFADKESEHLRASPITYVDERDGPMLLFQGTNDPLVPYSQAFEMAQALTGVGIPGRVEFILGAGHGWGGDEQQRTSAEELEFFDHYLRPKQ